MEIQKLPKQDWIVRDTVPAPLALQLQMFIMLQNCKADVWR